MGRSEHSQSSPVGFSHHEPTFVHREETLAQDAAAAPELHPEPTVRGGEGLRDFIATKPTWEWKRQVSLPADSEKLTTERGSGVSSMWRPVSRSLGCGDSPCHAKRNKGPTSRGFQTPVNRRTQIVAQTRPPLPCGSGTGVVGNGLKQRWTFPTSVFPTTYMPFFCGRLAFGKIFCFSCLRKGMPENI